MKYSLTIAFLASRRSPTHSLPSVTRPETFLPILNFALLAEHHESVFYQQALRRFSQSDFAAAGFSDWARDRFQQISDHEDTHATFLSSALTTSGAKAVAPCEYTFAFTDVQSFVDLSAALEAVGTAAYIGAAQFVDDKDYVTIAGSILAVEARHAAWINSAAKHDNPWGTAFDAALTPSQVYTVLAPLIESCPPSTTNALPALTAYPTLTVNNGRPGEVASFAFTAPPASTQLFVAFISSIASPVFVPLHENKAVVPADLAGFVFCLITTAGGLADDSTTVAGPTILNFPYGSSATFEL